MENVKQKEHIKYLYIDSIERALDELKNVGKEEKIEITRKYFDDSGSLPKTIDNLINNGDINQQDKELEYYNNIYIILCKLNEVGNKSTVFCGIKNEEIFRKSELYNYKNKNLKIDYDGNEYTFDEYKEQEQYLDFLVSEVKNSNMSPLEKYLAVYDIVKQYKQYSENEQHKNQSRRLKSILNNDYIVCVGFSKLLVTLLKRVGINSADISNGVDTSYDNGYTQEEVSTELQGHARVMVYLKDEKYNIDGYYIADPTWDNNLKDNYYNHALMTFDETTKEDRLIELTNIDLLFNVNSIEEYFQKVNILLDKSINRELKALLNEKEISKQFYVFLIKYILYILYIFDNNEIKKIIANYGSILEKGKDIDEKDCSEIITYFGYYILGKTNKKVSGDKIIDAAIARFQGVEDPKSLENYRKQLLEKNIKRQSIEFPERMVEYNDGRESEVISDKNKFSI